MRPPRSTRPLSSSSSTFYYSSSSSYSTSTISFIHPSPSPLLPHTHTQLFDKQSNIPLCLDLFPLSAVCLSARFLVRYRPSIRTTPSFLVFLSHPLPLSLPTFLNRPPLRNCPRTRQLDVFFPPISVNHPLHHLQGLQLAPSFH